MSEEQLREELRAIKANRVAWVETPLRFCQARLARGIFRYGCDRRDGHQGPHRTGSRSWG